MNKVQNWLWTFSSQKKKASIISITSGKGGVGKTSVAIKMSQEFSDQGKKTLLIDCDYNLSNTLIKLGLPINDNFYQLISNQKNFNECVIKKNNFHLLPGCNGHLNLYENKLALDQIIIDIVNEHEDEFDYIILDCPPGLNEKILNINSFSDHRIFILTPDLSSIADSYSLIKLLNLKYGIKENHLLVNRYTSNYQLNKVANSISLTAKQFLNCETIILGGIKEHENKFECFDDVFLSSKESKLHQNFTKVLQTYSDQRLESSQKN